ncbi:hypothetical protein BGX30_013351 [Mortierella sp. GBA39]|nr:hypothetical protein BGX30_013351 [Mortierella sp. GBA39]
MPKKRNPQRELICKNAFRVKSLRIDYSAKNLLDVPFGNLTRFSLNCRYSHTKDRTTDPGSVGDEMLKGVALELIARNPKLRELELSGLHSLKLNCRGIHTMEGICSIIENCPPGLQELTLHGYINYRGEMRFPDEQAMLDRFAAIKNNSIYNNYNYITTTSTNYPNRQRTPNLRLLNIDYNHIDYYYSRHTNEASIPETILLPILSCFPDLQDLSLPKLSDHWISHNGLELISILITSCPGLTNINFGDNFIPEKHMHRFLLSLPEGQLQGITMTIRPDFHERVLPILLERSASTLEVMRLRELNSEQCDIHQQRSSYVLEILASCPRLKTLAIVTSQGSGTSPWFLNLHLHDLLQKDWVCSALEVLSIGVLDLTAPPESNGLNKDKDAEEDAEATSTDNPELALYKRKIRTLTSFYLRLKSHLPRLTTLDFQWSKSCKDIPYDCAVEYSNSLLTLDNLRWMGLRSWTIHGLKTTAVQEALGALSKKEIDLFEEHRWQGKGIYVRTDEDNRRYRQREAQSRVWWRGMRSCCCSGYEEMDEEMDELMAEWKWEELQERVFDDLHDAYKSRSNRRRHGDAKWKK